MSFIPNKTTFTKYCLNQWISMLMGSNSQIQWVRRHLINFVGLAGKVNGAVYENNEMGHVVWQPWYEPFPTLTPCHVVKSVQLVKMKSTCVRVSNELQLLNWSSPGQNGLHFSGEVSNAFPWLKTFIFWLNFQWRLFLRAQMTQHWIRYWFGAEYATSHYLNQCWPHFLTHMCGVRGDKLNQW